MDTIRSITIVGLSAAASSATVPLGDEPAPLDTYIIERTGACSLEPTKRTEDLGKHFLLVDKGKLSDARLFLDKELPEFYKQHIGVELRQPGFAFPRRSN